MNQLTAATDELIAIVNADTATLKPLLGNGWLFMGLPQKYPCVTIDGLSRDGSKLVSYTATLNLWVDDQDIDLVHIADALLDKLKASNHIVTNGWLPRQEPENGLYRALFPVTIYV